MTRHRSRILGAELVVVSALSCLLPVAVAATESAAEPRTTRLQGSALAGRNQPVVGANVLVRYEEGDPRMVLTSIDGKGRFRVDGLENGTYHVRVDREGFAPVEKDRVDLRYPFRAVVELTMRRLEKDAGAAEPPAASSPSRSRLTLRGHVAESGAGSLAEVRLRLVRPDGAEDPRSLRSEADGEFVFADLGAGRWELTVEGIGFLVIRTTLELEHDATADVFLVQRPADYQPSPLELTPPEQPIPPPG